MTKTQCPSFKPGYISKEVAERAAVAASKRSGVTLATYECPDCREWHLTKSVGGHNQSVLGRRKKS